MQTNFMRLNGLTNCPFRALELLPTVEEDQVSQVFVRINSMGKKLNETDFILTLMSVYWDESHHALEKFRRETKLPTETASPHNHFLHQSPDQMLRAADGFGFKRGRLKYVDSLLRGRDLETGK